MSIYYLTASLPTLEFGIKPPISSQEFLADCQRLLSEADAKVIKQALEDQEDQAKNPTLKAWKEFTHRLRNELVWFRATEQNKDPALFLRGERQETDPTIFDALTVAAKAPDPLSAEKILDLLSWHKLDELGMQHYFDVDQLIIYGLKLKILERYATIASPKGHEIFGELKAAAAEQYL